MRSGFTLIELSIVLVIIGLIIGGVVVGRDLVNASAIRSQISQLEKYQTAVNTFRGKYGYLPGDIPDPVATQYGFAARGAEGTTGLGDGNGLIEGSKGGAEMGMAQGEGETIVFWVDLSTAGLIEGGFTTASNTSDQFNITLASNPKIAQFLPAAKIGGGNFVYVYSGGWWNSSIWLTNNINYFAISNVTNLNIGDWPYMAPGLSVSQAANIDTKIDDGLPISGVVTASYINPYFAPYWMTSTTGNNEPPPTTAARVGSAATCYDNSTSVDGQTATNGSPLHYSFEMNGGSGVNCALSFRFK